MLLIRKGILRQNRRKYSKSASKVNDVYILSIGRTPFGLYNGTLNKFTAPQLGSFAIKEALHRAVVPTEDLRNVFLGCALHQNYDDEIIRRTGLPTTAKLNVVSACGMEGFIEAIKFLHMNDQGVCLAGGMESMSNSSFFESQKILNLIKSKQKDTRKVLKNHFTNPDELNKFLELDYKNFIEANENGAYSDEIFKIAFIKKGQQILVTRDEILGKYHTSTVSSKGDINAEYSPAPGDGAAAFVASTEDYIRSNQLTPLAEMISFANTSIKANNLPLAQLRAIEKALRVAELESKEIARWEIDSIISDIIFSCVNHLNINISLVNKDGGIVGLGYPVGMFGIRALCHLIHSLSAGELGCAATCDLHGTASAVIIKKLSGKASEKPLLTLYSKKSCSLCHEVKEQLKSFKDEVFFEEVDIEAKKNKKYKKLYIYDIPVLFLDGRFLCKYQLDVEHFKRRLLESGNSGV